MERVLISNNSCRLSWLLWPGSWHAASKASCLGPGRWRCSWRRPPSLGDEQEMVSSNSLIMITMAMKMNKGVLDSDTCFRYGDYLSQENLGPTYTGMVTDPVAKFHKLWWKFRTSIALRLVVCLCCVALNISFVLFQGEWLAGKK